MTNYTQSSDREKLEQLFEQTEQKPAEKSKLSLSLLLNNIWEYLATAIAKNQEPQVWTSTDHFGHTWWHGYDPTTGRSVWRESEQEMRVWLEERYCQ